MTRRLYSFFLHFTCLQIGSGMRFNPHRMCQHKINIHQVEFDQIPIQAAWIDCLDEVELRCPNCSPCICRDPPRNGMKVPRPLKEHSKYRQMRSARHHNNLGVFSSPANNEDARCSLITFLLEKKLERCNGYGVRGVPDWIRPRSAGPSWKYHTWAPQSRALASSLSKNQAGAASLLRTKEDAVPVAQHQVGVYCIRRCCTGVGDPEDWLESRVTGLELSTVLLCKSRAPQQGQRRHSRPFPDASDLTAMAKALQTGSETSVACASDPGAGCEATTKVPGSENPVVIRTDFSDQAAWESIVTAIKAPYPFLPYPSGDADVKFLDDPAFQGLTSTQLLDLVSEEYSEQHSFLMIVDERTIAEPEHPLIMVNLVDDEDEEPQYGLEFRAIPSAVCVIECNLSIANSNFEDFAEDVDKDGVYRKVLEI